MKPGNPLKRTEFKRREKPLAPGEQPRRRKRLKPMSDKRRAEIPERQRVVAEVLARDGFKCRVAPFLPDLACSGPLDGHEPRTRARGGDPLDPDQVVTCCRLHHDWIHTNPDEATALGLLEHSWQEKEDGSE
jgi:hypothetical protein